MHYIMPFNIPKMMSHSLCSFKKFKDMIFKNFERENSKQPRYFVLYDREILGKEDDLTEDARTH